MNYEYLHMIDRIEDPAIRCAAEHASDGFGHLTRLLRILSMVIPIQPAWCMSGSCSRQNFESANAIIDLVDRSTGGPRTLPEYLLDVHLATLREAELSKQIDALVDALAYLSLNDWTEKCALESAHWALWRGHWCASRPDGTTKAELSKQIDALVDALTWFPA